MPMRNGLMEHLVRWVERLAGVFLFLVALTTVVTVVSRKLFNYSPPELLRCRAPASRHRDLLGHCVLLLS